MGILDLEGHEQQLLDQIEKAKNPTKDIIVHTGRAHCDEDKASLGICEKKVLELSEWIGKHKTDRDNVIEEEEQDNSYRKSNSQQKPRAALWIPDSDLPSHMVVEAHPILST